MKKITALSLLALSAMVPAFAQPVTDPSLPKFLTPPPAVTAENSIIKPPYADAPEYKVDPSVPQGDVREFILYSEDSKIYPGIVRIENEISVKRDAYGNRMPAPDAQVSQPGRY